MVQTKSVVNCIIRSKINTSTCTRYPWILLRRHVAASSTTQQRISVVVTQQRQQPQSTLSHTVGSQQHQRTTPSSNSTEKRLLRTRNMSTATKTDTIRNEKSNGVTSTNVELDIEELHERACVRGEMSYIDPATGFTCFTKLAHLKRGVCCGNYCRHCPYNWKNAKKGNTTTLTSNECDSDDSSNSSSDESNQFETDYPSELLPLHTNDESINQQLKGVAVSPCATAGADTGSKTGGKYGGTYTKKNVVYTRGGDTGTSQLLNGERRKKSDIVFEALGTVDELCSIVGVCYAELGVAIKSIDATSTTGSVSNNKEELEHLLEWLLEIMSRLFDIGSHVAKPRKLDKEFVADGVGNGFDSIHIQELEMWIDTMTEALPELTSFVLPTGSCTSAQLHVARTVCRRTERTIVPLVLTNPDDSDNNESMSTTTTTVSGCDPNALAYINRLSDFFFTAARFANDRLGIPDIAYQRPTRSSKQRTRVVLKSSK